MAAAGAVANLIGAGITSGVSWKIAKDQRDWQERMSNTAYQRGVKDLRLAGLNPILAAKFGGGATTPPGAMATIPDLSKLGTTALAGMRLRQELKNMKANEIKEKNLAQLASAQWNLADNQSALINMQTRAAKYGLPKAKETANYYSTTAGKASLNFGLGRENLLGGGIKIPFIGK